jgi:hypothetical protein
MTRIVLFPQLRFRQFKRFYLDYGGRHLRTAFLTLPSYHRWVELLPRCAAPVAALGEGLKGACDGIAIVAAPPLAGCDNRRIVRHRVFQDCAGRGKTARGWFSGFKLHTIIPSKGELIRLKGPPGNGADRKPLPPLCTGLFGHLFADKGDLAHRLTQPWAKQDIPLITPLRKNIKPVPRTAFEKALRRRRCRIDTVFDECKPLGQIEHPRHRSVGPCRVNLIAGLLAYCLSDPKPTLKLTPGSALARPSGLIPNSG